MIHRCLTLAVTTALFPVVSQATDLLQVYEMARTADPQLSAAESTRLYSREGQVQARAALLPQMNGTVALSRSRTEYDGISGSAISKNRQYSINGTQTLFNWNQFATLRSQQAVAKAADFTLESAKQSLIVRSSAAYFSVLIGIESLIAAEANEASAKRQFDYAQKRLEVGLSPITDLHEARASYDQARADTITARNTLQDYYQALAEITGQPVTDLRGLPEDFRPEVPAKFSNIDQLVSEAISNNPSLKAQQLQVDAAEASISAARGEHYPTLSLGGNLGKSKAWGSSSGAMSAMIPSRDLPSSDTNNLQLTLTVPFFAGGATQSRVRQAIAQHNIQQDNYEQNKRTLNRNTRNAYQNMVAGISEVEARRLAVVSAQAALDASQVGLEVGTRTLLDVVQNQRILFSVRQTYVQARYNFLQNRLLLAQNSGTLNIEDVQDINRLLTANAESKL
ncbi:TolC family outer membrane protein [Xylella taiwanensis]|uniref:Membrane protein n=1 Tax=Xylella taiwanensis TaxID=1444770 RepID=Z9JH21_9GAMM|nr:TolC family outer membrane protein [Xylella taiwanensis]AXI84278.1 membrane protein [Xylella taiwanensis]EWS77710.1 membrane protein [Xylella taiwanensis]MCD8457394.1 TolC family outer membrane protein [Xylella taiwanensis]MCD8457552.1 TolC family outer membrane protein [Xylella taiwanensis]MCD8461324.1 TolC family outer membrane protein [Xylella taiwanensis]